MHRNFANAQGRQVTDKKDEYYQPWLRDPSPAPEPLPRADEGLAKPKDAPPVGIDVGLSLIHI